MNKFIKNVCQKNKVLCFSSLLLTTSIVCPLTSCGSDGTSNDIGGFDQEFGFDAQTYNNLERQFISKYGASLIDDKGIEKDVYINKFNNFLQNDLTILRNKLFDPAQNYSFTVRTNTLIDYASKNYNIQLNRNTNISDIDFDNLRQSSLENFVIYMENMGFTKAEIDNEKVKFNREFDVILSDGKSKADDNAKILMQLRADVINCWQNLDDEFAYLSAYNHLKKFFDEYEFIVKDQEVNNENGNLWDKLLNNSKFMGENNAGKIDQDINHIIDEEQINDLFTISKKSQESEKEDNKDTPANDTSLAETNSYNQEIIPGFILTPVLKTMSQNIYSNEYYMNIDWQLLYAKYQNNDQETKDKVTAHLAYNKDEQMVNDDNSSDDVNNNNFSSNDYQFTRYSLKATPDYQIKKMTEAYFDQTKESDQKITFSWDEDKIGIEYFLPSNIFSGENGKYNLPQDDKYNVSISQENLSLIGLQLNGNNLSDLLNEQKKLQDDQSTNNINDDNLTIEEKFVKYCDINANAIVKFNDTTNISKNIITNNFISVFKNTNLPDEVKIEQDLQSNNITKSKNFTNNAVLFFNNIVNFVDTNKITNEVDSSAKLTTIVNVEILIILAITIIIFIELIRERKFPFKYINRNNQHARGIVRSWKNTIKIIIIIAILVAGLILFWYFFAYKPINQQNQNVKKWNDEITDKSKSNINIIKKVNGTDKDNFKSSENFDKYFENNQFDAFRSFFYYFHFNHLISKNNDESLKDDDIWKEIDNDYKQFNDTKKQYNVTINNDKIKYYFIVIASITLLFLIIFLIKLFVSYFKDKKNLIARAAAARAAAAAAAHGAHGVVHHGLQ